MSQRQEFDVIVIGGGLVGAAAALALARLDLAVALVEAAAPPQLPADDSWDSRIYAISPGNVRFLAELGVWGRQELARIAPIDAMQVWGDAGAELLFSADESQVSALGYIVESRLMQHALWATMREQPNIRLYCPAHCVGLEFLPDHAVLALEDGTVLKAKLIAGADGGASWSRTQAGIGARTRDYEQMGVVANFMTEMPPRNIARQWFRPDGILAWLPLPNRRMSMVWSTDPVHARDLLTLAPQALADKVAEAGEHVLGGLSTITAAAAFPLRLQNAEVLTKPRFVLLGDAGHLVHPLAGQGVNLGFHDVVELIRVMQERGPQHDVGDYGLLRRFERARKLDIAAMQTVTTGLQVLFKSDLPGLARLRNVGLELTNRQAWLKRKLIAHAML